MLDIGYKLNIVRVAGELRVILNIFHMVSLKPTYFSKLNQFCLLCYSPISGSFPLQDKFYLSCPSLFYCRLAKRIEFFLFLGLF